MHKLTVNLKCSFWIVFLILLAGCAPGRPGLTPTLDINAIRTQGVKTIFAQLTQDRLTTRTATSSPGAVDATQVAATAIAQFTQLAADQPTATRTPMFTTTPLAPFTLQGLRAAYIIDGNLYVQDSGKEPLFLTRSIMDTTLIFSDDGKKIVFYRGTTKYNQTPYVINIDGSHEQSLTPVARLTALNPVYTELTYPVSPAFIPHTHNLLFQTCQFDPTPRGERGLPDCSPNSDLLVSDVDTGKIHTVFQPGQASYYEPSPNGKLIWVLSVDHLEVTSPDGKLVRRLKDYPNTATILKPQLYWSQDSSKLNLVLPPLKSAIDSNGPEPMTIWQVSLQGGAPVEIHFDPTPIDAISISPDGNWLLYSNCCYYGNEHQSVKLGLYLGDLRKGTSQLVEVPEAGLVAPSSYRWNTDSTHYVFDANDHAYVGDIQGKSVRFHGGLFVDWIDKDRYLRSTAMGELGKDGFVRVIDLPADNKFRKVTYFTFVLLKSK